MRPTLPCALLPLLAAAGDPAASAFTARLVPADTPLLAQVMHAEELPVAGAIPLGSGIPCAPAERGALRIDPAGSGAWRTVTATAAIDVAIPGSTPRRSVRIRLAPAGGGWTWRMLTQAQFSLGSDALIAVDLNGNGSWNDVGVDGLAWAGQRYAFPFPGPGEAWCTPSQVVTGFTLAADGSGGSASLAPLATTLPSTLPILHGINQERVLLGLTPRPEDSRLSADLQKHCAWMRINDRIDHPEAEGTPGRTAEGHAAGMRSILSAGVPAGRMAWTFMGTFYHRIDVMRPETLAFGVGIDGRYGGIDGRTAMAKRMAITWPILCPAPFQTGVPLRFNGPEMPDPAPGDEHTGYPIIAYFGGGKPTFTAHRLVAVAANGAESAPIDCLSYDHQQGGDVVFNRDHRMLGLLPRDPLAAQTRYRVTMAGTVGGKPWSRTWDFATGDGRAPGQGSGRRR